MKKVIKFLVMIFLINIILLGGNYPSYAQQEAHKTFIVIVDRVTPQQLLEYGGTNLRLILDNSSWAILSNTTARGKASENQAMTIGAGSRAVAPNGVYFFNKGENLDGTPADIIYTTFNNKDVEDEVVFNPYVQNIIYHNEQLNHTVEIGVLGETLKQQGLTRVAVGNSDDFDQLRHASSILMDSNGNVDYGMVDERALIENNQFPGGYSTDYFAIMEFLDTTLESGDVFLIDTGDLHRLDTYYRYYEPEKLNSLIEDTIGQMDELFNYLLNIMEEQDQLYLITLNSPHSLREEGENIPVIYHYNKNNSGSILTAPSTKRPGVVTTLDIAPTILSSYGMETVNLYGSVMSSMEVEDHQGVILAQLNQINTVYNQRPFIIRFYIVVTIIIVLAFLVNLKLNSIKNDKFSYLILMAMAGPLVFLLMPLFGPINIVPYLAIFYILCTVVAILIRKMVLKPIDGAIVLSAVTVIAVIIDTLFNSYLQKQSVLGYDVIGGARFYGVGNEYMGVILGGSIFATLPLMFKSQHKKWLYILYGIIIFIMMAPFYGTNFGGTLALSVTYGVVLVEIKKGKGLYKHILALAAVFAVAVGVMVTMNVMTENQTHIGRTFSGDNVNRLEEILMAITRKLSMNWRLVKFSIWSRIFAVLLLSTIIIGFYPPKKFEFLKDKYYYRAVKAILAGSLAALFLNDSGIVAAATAMLFLALPLLYIFCCDNSESTSSQSK